MSTRKPFTLIAATIFAAMALVHIYRIATDFQIIVGSHSLSMAVSYLAIRHGRFNGNAVPGEPNLKARRVRS